MLDYKKFRSDQAAARAQGRLMGIGFSTYIEACSIAPSKVVGSLGAQAGLWESGKVQVHPTGKVSVFTGSHSHGQGHETTMAQIVADHLGIPMDDVEIVHGDTGRVPFGMGTYGSRSASVGGTAIVMSLDKIKEKGKKIAAHLLEANPKDMEYVGGQFVVKGSPQKAIPFGQVALTAYVPHNYPEGLEPGLEETSFYDPVQLLLPVRGPRLRGRGRSRHRPRQDPPLPRGRRRRQRHQPDDRGRHGARRASRRASRRRSGKRRSTTATPASS